MGKCPLICLLVPLLKNLLPWVRCQDRWILMFSVEFSEFTRARGYWGWWQQWQGTASELKAPSTVDLAGDCCKQTQKHFRWKQSGERLWQLPKGMHIQTCGFSLYSCSLKKRYCRARLDCSDPQRSAWRLSSTSSKLIGVLIPKELKWLGTSLLIFFFLENNMSASLNKNAEKPTV